MKLSAMFKYCIVIVCFCIGSLYSMAQGWSELGVGSTSPLNVRGQVSTIALDSMGCVYIGGSFVDSTGFSDVVKWNHMHWKKLSPANRDDSVLAIATAESGVFVARSLANGDGACYVSQWDGSQWSGSLNLQRYKSYNNRYKYLRHNYSINVDGSIYSFVFDDTGELYIAGDFMNASNSCYVYKCSERNCSELDSATNVFLNCSRISALAVMRETDMYTTGFIENNSPNMRHYNVYAAGVIGRDSLQDEKYLVVNKYGITQKNWMHGGHWTTMGASNTIRIMNDSKISIAVDSSNNVYVCGYFQYDSQHINVLKWDGTKWTELGIGINTLKAVSGDLTMALDDYGNVYVGGALSIKDRAFTGVAKWNGKNWSEVGGDRSLFTATNGNSDSGIKAMTVDGSGDIYVAFDSSLRKPVFVMKYSVTRNKK